MQHQEQILLKDIFMVSLQPCEGLQQLPGLATELGPTASFVENDSLFDAMLFERLQVPGTSLLQYLSDCFDRCEQQRGKPWNESPEASKFIAISVDRIISYAVIALSERDMFPEQTPLDPSQFSAQSARYVPCTLAHQLERGFLADELLQALLARLEESFPKVKADLLDQLLTRLASGSAIDPKTTRLNSVIASLLTKEEFRRLFYCSSRFPISAKRALDLEGGSCFGPILRHSMLGFSAQGPQEQKINLALLDKYAEEMSRIKFKRDFDFAIKQIQARQNEVSGQVCEIFKLLLRKDSQAKTLLWLANALALLQPRSQIGHMFYDDREGGSDGAALLLFDVLLEISKVFLDPDNDRLRLIDPEYMAVTPRYRNSKLQPLNSGGRKMVGREGREFGTVSEFFFMSMELLSVALVPALNNLVRLNEAVVKGENEVKKLNEFMRKKVEHELNLLKGRYLVYFSVLSDESRVKQFVRLSVTFMALLPKWLGLDLHSAKDGHFLDYKSCGLEGVLPENFVLSQLELHSSYAQLIDNYGENYLGQGLERIVDLGIMLLSPIKLSSNPHTGAKLVETLYKIAFSNARTRAFSERVIGEYEPGHRNLARLIVEFYINVAFTGSSNQYYAKFEYRHYSNQILKMLCKFEAYRASIRAMEKEELFKRFLNMLVSDANFMLQEGAENLVKQRGEEEGGDGAKYFLQQLSDNLRLIAEFSSWSNSSFRSEELLVVLIPMLNSFLRGLVDPSNVLSDKALTRKYKFENEFVLRDLITVIANLGHEEEIVNQILRDERSYDLKWYIKAKDRAELENATPDAVLERFATLIGTLTNSVDMDKYIEDFPDVYACKLMFTLLKDPVMLPTSRNIVEKAHIHSYLFNDERDPFNRAPLKVEDLQPLPALKAEIEAWKKDKLEEILGKKRLREESEKLVESEDKDQLRTLRFEE